VLHLVGRHAEAGRKRLDRDRDGGALADGDAAAHQATDQIREIPGKMDLEVHGSRRPVERDIARAGELVEHREDDLFGSALAGQVDRQTHCGERSHS